jgi:DNA-binding transcriptional LysR family regulator
MSGCSLRVGAIAPAGCSARLPLRVNVRLPLPPGDRDALAGHPPGLVGGEKKRDLGDVLGLADPLAAVEDAENSARGADRISGVLRVALPTTYGVRRIVPLLPAFLDRHPRLKIDLMMSDYYENLIAEGAELALRVGQQPDSSFVARKLESARRLFVAAPSYLARRGAPERLGDLAQHDLIGGGPAAPGEHSWAARRNGRTEIAPVEQRVHARSAAGVVACAVASLGIAVASIWMCAEELASGALAEVLTDYALDPIVAFIVFPAGRRPANKARVFADYLERAVMQSRNSPLE